MRKTAPKEVPFKAYIYCTYGNDRENYMLGSQGKIIGEFICDKVYKIEPIFSFYDCYSGYDDSSDFSYFEDYSIDSERLKKTCLTRQELYIYGKEKNLYGWHISDLKIYARLAELEDKIESGTLVPKYSVVESCGTYCVCSVDTENLLVIDEYETEEEAQKKLEELENG